MSEERTAEHLQAIFDGATAWDTISRRRLAHRLAGIEADADLEVNQFRAVQQAIRESPALAAALEAGGFHDLAGRETRRVDPETGALIQAFNRLIESRWKP